MNQKDTDVLKELKDNRKKIWDYIGQKCETVKTNEELLILETISTIMHEVDTE